MKEEAPTVVYTYLNLVEKKKKKLPKQSSFSYRAPICLGATLGNGYFYGSQPRRGRVEEETVVGWMAYCPCISFGIFLFVFQNSL